MVTFVLIPFIEMLLLHAIDPKRRVQVMLAFQEDEGGNRGEIRSFIGSIFVEGKAGLGGTSCGGV